MLGKASMKALLEPIYASDEKQAPAQSWLARHLRRPAARQDKDYEEILHEPLQISPPRPQTAPTIGHAVEGFPYASFGEPPLQRPRNKPPPRPPRPESGVIRDVNAWLDASMIKPAPLMGGLPYWREGPFTGSTPSADVRYAVPIAPAPELERPSTSHSQSLKSFCRRARKIQVRMPSLLRAGSHRVAVPQAKNRRSKSMPLLATPSSEAVSVPTQDSLVRSRSLMHMSETSSPETISSQGRGWLRTGRTQFLGLPARADTPSTSRFGEQESIMERRVNAVFGQTSRLGDTRRPSTATHHHIPREDSMGNVSDTPTYFSGPPPPSYRSRSASNVTTSSFGCIDGMNRVQRQMSQQKAAAQRSRGVKGKIKKMAQKAHITM